MMYHTVLKRIKIVITDIGYVVRSTHDIVKALQGQVSRERIAPSFLVGNGKAGFHVGSALGTRTLPELDQNSSFNPN